jgi:hypothetical protein
MKRFHFNDPNIITFYSALYAVKLQQSTRSFIDSVLTSFIQIILKNDWFVGILYLLNMFCILGHGINFPSVSVASNMSHCSTSEGVEGNIYGAYVN